MVPIVNAISCYNFISTGSAKPSSLRAKFENFAKTKEEEDLKRAAEQKRLREEKDRLDREQATQSVQTNRTETSAAAIEKPQRRGVIDTGRSGGIGNAINIFNKPDTEPIAPIQRVMSIQ